MTIISTILLIFSVAVCVAVYKTPPLYIVAVVLASAATTLCVAVKLCE